MDIATDKYKNSNPAQYTAIPENRIRLIAPVFRNPRYETDSPSYKTDLAINQDQYSLPEGNHYVIGRVADVGDLAESYGYNETDAEGLTFTVGKVYENPFKTVSELSPSIVKGLLQKG